MPDITNPVSELALLDLTILRCKRDLANARSFVIAGAVSTAIGVGGWLIFKPIGALLLVAGLISALRGGAQYFGAWHTQANAQKRVAELKAPPANPPRQGA